MRKFCSLLACMLAVLPAVAGAQSLPSPSAFTLKAGFSIPANANIGNSGFAFGADYIFHPATTLEPFNVSFYGDLLGKNGGAGVAIRNGGPAYIGAGLGLYSASIPTGSATGLGGKIFGGFDVAPHTTLEIGYHVLPKVAGANTNIVSAQLGFRF